MGVSLFSNLYKFFYNMKAKEPLPGALAFLCCSRKRETPPCICRKGSLTVEASIVLPLFTGFFVFLLFYFRIMGTQLAVQNALEETGRNLALLSASELQNQGADTSYFPMAKGMLYLKLKEEQIIEQYVSGGAFGVSLLMSEFEGDYIQLKANYLMHFPIGFFGKQDFLICQKTLFRKWTGWRGIEDKGEPEELVYVTEYGEVYHARRSCAYLELSIQKVTSSELRLKRNCDGERYTECETCLDEKKTVGGLYITDYGDRYHYTIDCPGLKRIIYQKKLLEVGGMPACSKCTK